MSITEEFSIEDILNNKKSYLKQFNSELYDVMVSADPAMAMLEIDTYLESIVRNKINRSIEAVTIDYALAEDLDNLAGLYGLLREEKEEDNSLRQRVKALVAGISSVGPKDAYVNQAKSVSGMVKDAALLANKLEVIVYILSNETLNGEPTDELIKEVYKSLNSSEIRPLGDRVLVKKAEIVDYIIDLKVTFTDDKPVDKDSIIEKIRNNLQIYAQEQHKIGACINAAMILSLSLFDGVEDLKIATNIDVVGSIPKVPYCKAIRIVEAIK